MGAVGQEPRQRGHPRGSQAPLPTSTASTAFMVIGNTGAMDVVIPFAESDASRIAAEQDAQVTFDAVSNVSITGKVLAVRHETAKDEKKEAAKEHKPSGR